MIWITISIIMSVAFETASYLQQIRKTVRSKHSNDVSAKSYAYKLLKYVFALIATYLTQNYVGFGLEVWAFGLCIVTYIIVRKNKVRHGRPKGKRRSKRVPE